MSGPRTAFAPRPTEDRPDSLVLYAYRAPVPSFRDVSRGMLLALGLPSGEVIACRDLGRRTTGANFAVAADRGRVYHLDRSDGAWTLDELEAPISLDVLRRVSLPPALDDWGVLGQTITATPDGRQVYFEVARIVGTGARRAAGQRAG